MADDTSDPLRASLQHGAKAMMRRRFRMLRRAVPAGAIAQRSQAICERLWALPEIECAATVALFHAIARHHEVDLAELHGRLRAAGRRLAYPSLSGDPKQMDFRLVDSLDELQERGNGFAEPPDTATEATALDVILVPGIAFDARGYRIGYGAGYYDRALPRYRPPALAIGVAFAFQLAADIPNADHDVPVDHVVTDGRVFTARIDTNSDS